MPYPQQRNIVDKGYVDYVTTKMRKKIYRVPDGVVDTAPTEIELPEPFLHGSVLYFRNGLLEPIDNVVELNNLVVQIPQAPLTGANRETLEFEYLPASLIGRNAYKNMLTFTFDANRSLSAEMVSFSLIRVQTTTAVVTMTLPTLTATENGSRVMFYRDGSANVEIASPGGIAIDNLAGNLTMSNNLRGVELIYAHGSSRWNIVGKT
jgi:hypothetical protein